MSSVVLSQHTPQHTPQPRLLSLSRTAFDFLSRLTAPMNTGLNSSSLNSLNGSLTERTPLLPNSSSTSLFTDEGFPDDPPPYYSSDVESNPDELPTYAQVQVLSPNQHGDEDEDWVDKCSNCVMPFFFFMLLIGAAFLTILPLTWSDPPLNTSPTPGPPMVPIPYIQPSPSRPYPSSKYTQPRAQSPDTLTSTHTPSTYDSSSPHRTHETPLGLTSLTPNLSTTHMGLDEGRTNRNAPLSKSIQHRRNIAPALGDRIHIPPLVDISKFVV
ncbi:hypothetical protein BSLG_002314 [Batrachochytrium salamandrivorans]|nr:hypothetical protein BSLG_002314 [Batrachochytrium salamandrivorans]